MTIIHWTILVLLVFTATTYAARTFFFRNQVRRLLGFFDFMGEMGHSGCALLMVPMVVPALMGNAQVRAWAAALSLLGGLFFTGEAVLVQRGVVRKYPQYRSWWSYAHGGMYLGMAHMYWAHDHVIINSSITSALTWVTGAFFVWFCGYYLYALLIELVTTWGTSKWALYLQANVSHLFGIGLPMLGMVLWPHVFMAMSGHDHATDAPHEHQHGHDQHERPQPQDAAAQHHHHHQGQAADETSANPSIESE